MLFLTVMFCLLKEKKKTLHSSYTILLVSCCLTCSFEFSFLLKSSSCSKRLGKMMIKMISFCWAKILFRVEEITKNMRITFVKSA